ncbi:MAG: hypothetical protein HBSIN02_19770 [Bacteroidia bacterium]|nr:MAG: hypothetical protein HBSIN02_19770 [Bacteroidia bacterium]
MNRYLSTVVAFFLVLGTVVSQEKPKAVSGGLGRTAALGGNPTNPYIQDFTDVFVNPAYAAWNKDLLFGELGNSFGNQYFAPGQYAAYTLGLGNLAVGVAIGKREGPMFAENSYGAGLFANSDYMIPSINGYAGFGTGEPQAPFHVFAAYRAGFLTIGGALYRSSWSYTDDGTGTVGAMQKFEVSNNQTGFKAGMLLELSSSFLVDAGVLFRLNSSTADFSDANPGANPTAASYDATGTEIGVNGRAFMKFSDKLTLVPQVRFATFGYEPEIADNSTPAPPSPVLTKPNDFGRTEFEVGVGVNSTFEGGWVSVGAAVQSISLTNDVTTQPGGPGNPLQTTKNKMSWFDLPKLNVGAEFELLSWLYGRLGYFKRISSVTTTSEPPAPGQKSENTISSEPGYIPSLGFTPAQQQVSLGLGILVNRISIDGYVGERVLASGTWLLSGRLQDIFGVLSISVKFD